MSALAIVAILATNGWAAAGYEVINQGDSVEVRPLPDLPEPEVKKAMLAVGRPALGRENFLLSSARKASRTMKSLLRRAASGTQSEE